MATIFFWDIINVAALKITNALISQGSEYQQPPTIDPFQLLEAPFELQTKLLCKRSAIYENLCKVESYDGHGNPYSKGAGPRENSDWRGKNLNENENENENESFGNTLIKRFKEASSFACRPAKCTVSHITVLSWRTSPPPLLCPNLSASTGAQIESLLQASNTTVPRLFVEAKMKSQGMLLCLDTGANSSAMPADLYKTIDPSLLTPLSETENEIHVLDASGNAMPHAFPPALIKFALGNIEFETKFLILSNLTIPILGMQFFRENEIVIINKQNQKSYIEVGHPNPIATIPCCQLTNSYLQPMESKILNPGYNQIKFKPGFPENSIVCVSLLDEMMPLKIYEHAYQVTNNEINVEVWNFASSEYYLSEQSPILKIEPCKDSFIAAADCSYETDQMGIPSKPKKEVEPQNPQKDFSNEPDQNEMSPNSWEEFLDPKGLDIDFSEVEKNDSTIWISQLKKAGFPMDLLPKFICEIEKSCPQVFAKHALDAGCLDPKIMVIKDVELKPGAVVRCKPFKMDFVRRTQCDRILEKLEEHNIIRKGSSQYYSPVFIISKADNRLRMVTSYCTLNSMMKQVFYSIPDTKLIIQQISETNGGQIYYFTQLDLSNAYSSIKVEGKAQEQFALATQTNTYLVQRLLFGAQCAPAYFNEAVKKVIAQCENGKEKFIYSFFDDVTIVTGNDRNFHLQKVIEAITALGQAGFKFRADKCHYFKKQVDILGCRINRFGVMPMDRHIKAIKNISTPTTLQEAQRIQGLLNWHAHLLPMFSEKIKPVTKLSMKNQPFEWGEEQKECIKWFQLHITSRIMTHFPDYNSEIYVCSDASKLAVGGIAYQIKSFDRKYEHLVENLLVDEKQLQEKRLFPVIPVSGKKCPKFFDLQGHDSKIKELLDESMDLNVNSSQTKQIHLCCPVAYFSRSLSKTQQSYTTLEIETLAAVSTIMQFHSLLLGFKERYFFSDCQPLLYLVKGASTGILKFERWLQRLNQVPIHFTIVHVKGQFNFMADFLSRFYFFGLVETPSNKLNRKMPVIIRSPFKPGQMVSIQDIDHALRNDPGIVMNISPKENIQIVTHSELESDNYLYSIPEINQRRPALHYVNTINALSVPQYLSLINSTIFLRLKEELTMDNIKKWQSRDTLIIPLLTNQTKSKMYIIKNGLLYRKKHSTQIPSEPDEADRIFVPLQLLACVIAYFHLQNHAGARSIFEMVRSEYYYPNLFYKIQDFTNSCYLCMMFKARKLRHPTPKHPFFPVKKAGVWAMDIIQGFQKFDKYKSILTIVDLYSQFTILKPLRYETANEVKTILVNTIFSCFPVPDLLISDGAKNLLKSKAIRRLAYYYNVGLHITSPYSSESNGAVEIVNRKAKTLLAALNDQLNYPWPKLLNFVMICLNSKPLTSRANLTPYFIMYGRENNTFRPNFTTKEKELIGLPELVENWTQSREIIEKIITKWHKKKDEDNAKRTSNPPNIYAKGDFVYVLDKRPKTKKKLKPLIYRTPMMILADYGAAVLLKNAAGQVLHMHKRYVFRVKSFDKEAYETLPTIVKLRIGFSYTHEELKNYFFNVQEIPEIFSNYGKNPDIIDEKLQPPEEIESIEEPETGNDIPEEDEIIDDPEEEENFMLENDEDIEGLIPLQNYLNEPTQEDSGSDSDSDTESGSANFEEVAELPRRSRRIRFNLLQQP